MKREANQYRGHEEYQLHHEGWTALWDLYRSAYAENANWDFILAFYSVPSFPMGTEWVLTTKD